MILLGIILLLLGVGVGVVAYLATLGRAGTISVEAFGFTRDASAIELAIYGAAAVLLFSLGWALISAALRRRSRAKRTQRENARVAELEGRTEEERVGHERRWQDAGMRDEDLTRRERELSARHDGLDAREQDLARRESELRGRQGPSDGGSTGLDDDHDRRR